MERSKILTDRIREPISFYVNLEPVKELAKKAWYWLGIYAQAEAARKKKPGKRKDFSKSVKITALEYQRNRCKLCRKTTDIWDYHHKNSNRSDNSQNNCEVLCLTCHARKTRKK